MKPWPWVLSRSAEQVEVSLEGAVLVAGTGVAGPGVEDVAPVAGAFQVLLRDVALARIGSGLVDGPVIVGIFEGHRGRTAGGLHWHVPEAHHLAGALVVGYGGAAHHGFQGHQFSLALWLHTGRAPWTLCSEWAIMDSMMSWLRSRWMML